MLLRPKQTKYQKYHKGKISLNLNKNINFIQLKNGNCGLKALEPCRLSSKHIETMRRTIKKIIKRSGKIWLNTFPHIPVTSKPNENRMGKGKGKTKYFVCKVKSGDILVELFGINVILASHSLYIASKKLPIKTCLVKTN